MFATNLAVNQNIRVYLYIALFLIELKLSNKHLNVFYQLCHGHCCVHVQVFLSCYNI